MFIFKRKCLRLCQIIPLVLQMWHARHLKKYKTKTSYESYISASDLVLWNASKNPATAIYRMRESMDHEETSARDWGSVNNETKAVSTVLNLSS